MTFLLGKYMPNFNFTYKLGFMCVKYYTEVHILYQEFRCVNI